ncbi:MAG: single-stranded DNA-binding protein [Cyclobacteriaceae bacterium]
MSINNSVKLNGRLGQDAEHKTNTNGEMITFSLATTESYLNKAGEKVQSTEWHKLVKFGKNLEKLASYLKKGTAIMVEGRLQTRKWEDSKGSTHYTTSIIVEQLAFNGASKSVVGNNVGAGANAGADQPSDNTKKEPAEAGGGGSDDLPF